MNNYIKKSKLLLISLVIVSCVQKGEQNENKASIEPLPNKCVNEKIEIGKIDSVLKVSWKITEYRITHHYERNGRAITDLVFERKLFKENRTIPIEFLPKGVVIVNDTANGYWYSDSKRAQILFAEVNLGDDIPFLPQTKYHISIEPLLIRLTSKLSDGESNKYWVEFILIPNQ